MIVALGATSTKAGPDCILNTSATETAKDMIWR